MEELELYKLLTMEDNEYETALVEELGWVSGDEFLVWVSYTWIVEFIEALNKIFGDGLFYEIGGFNGKFQNDGVCLNLSEAIGGYGIDLKKMFPMYKFKLDEVK